MSVPKQALAMVSLVVHEYDEAIEYFVGKLGFELVEDRAEAGKRWVVVSPPGSATRMLLARAANAAQAASIGAQTGGRVFLFLHTDDFRRDYEAWLGKGVDFTEEPREEAYGTVAVFKDLYGNKWDLVQPKEG